MLEFLCYLASQTLRGSFYIVFMLTLQRLLRNQLSPRVRAALWAPLLIALLAPQLCVVRVPVSQPVETTVVDALEQTRAALALDVKSPPSASFQFDGRDAVYLPDAPTPLDNAFRTVASPFGEIEKVGRIFQEICRESQKLPFSADATDAPFVDAEAPSTFESLESFASPESESVGPFENSESFAGLPSEPTANGVLSPDFDAIAQPVDSNRLNENADLSEATVAPLASTPASSRFPKTLAKLESETRPAAQRSPSVDRRVDWFAFFQTAGIVALAIWAFGLVVATVYFVRSARVCRRWVGLSAPVDDADVLALYRRCAASLEIAAPPRLATTTDLSSPALLGWRRPVVLVPSEYVDDLSEERLKHVLLHELGHFKRGDAATGFLAFVVLATHWFNPLFWLAARSFYATREEACDAIALGSPALTNPNSAAEYARTLCEIAGRRPFVEQAFGAVGFSPTFRSLRRRVETLGRFGTWGRRAAIGCLLASLGAASFATVRLRPDVDANSPSLVADSQEKRDSYYFAKLRRVAESLGPIPKTSDADDSTLAVPVLSDNDPLVAAACEALERQSSDRLVVELEALQLSPDGRPVDSRSLGARQTFAARTVATLQAAQESGDAEFFAALGDYLTRESGFFWRFFGVDASASTTILSSELDAALDRAERTGDPNFRFLAKLHRALADETRTTQAAFPEKIAERFVLPTLDGSAKKRLGWNLRREFDAGQSYLVEAAALGNVGATARLARFADVDVPLESPRGRVVETEFPATISQDSAFDAKFKYAFAAAQAGSPESQALVAVYFARGVGVERNLAEALRWGERFYDADVASGDSLSPLEPGDVAVPPSRRLFLERSARGYRPIGATDVGPLNCSKYWTTFLWLAEAALDSEPTPENLALAEKFLRRANRFESRSPFAYRLVPRSDEGEVGVEGVFIRVDDLRVTAGFVEANERLADAFLSGAFGVQDDAKANEFGRFAQEFADEIAQDARSLRSSSTPRLAESTADASENAENSENFVAPQTPEFEAVIAPIFAKLEKTLVDAKNGNADALTARFNEYFDDATDLYPNGRPGAPEVARYKVERLTQEIERLEQTDADAATLERLRKSRDSWRRLADASRLADETPVVATNA